MNILGIDPGENGGFAFISTSGDHYPCLVEFKTNTRKDIAQIVKYYSLLGPCTCFIEKVHAAPRQGVSSTFTFGKNYGFWLGILTVLEISFEEVSPQTWQGCLGFKSPRGATYNDRKRLLKQRAEQLYPSVPISLGTADAVLIAEYGRRLYNSRENKNPSR